MNLTHVLQRQVAERPDAPALVTASRGRNRAITFAELDLSAQRLARLLHDSGLRAGDAVLVLQPVGIDLYVTLLAVFRLGLVAMFLDPSAGRGHVERCCSLRPPDAMVGTPKAHLLRLGSAALRRVRRKFVVGGPAPGAVRVGRARRLSPYTDVQPCEADAPALLTFTSGTTGAPKAAVRSHGLLAAQQAALARCLSLTPGQVDLTTLPVFALANLASGVTSLVPDADLRRPGRIDPGPVVEQVLRHRPRSTVASPALLKRVAGECARRGLTLPSFDRVFTGGAPVFLKTVEKLRQMAPAARVVSVYGSTEAEPMAHVAHDEVSDDDRAATLAGGGLLAGRPVPEVHLRILPDRWGQPLGQLDDQTFGSMSLPAGAAGEIVVSGEHILPRYLGGRGDAETKFRVGGRVWHRTGDAGYLDPAGRLWLVGRCSARLDDDHGTTYPLSVEAAAAEQPGVARAGLLLLGPERVLAVEPDDGAACNPSELTQALAWAHLDRVVFTPIPVDSRHNAKVDYAALRRSLENA
jgi:acyl-CoA synthetase (AMP-forming)/AMP-acid ligase II